MYIITKSINLNTSHIKTWTALIGRFNKLIWNSLTLPHGHHWTLDCTYDVRSLFVNVDCFLPRLWTWNNWITRTKWWFICSVCFCSLSAVVLVTRYLLNIQNITDLFVCKNSHPSPCICPGHSRTACSPWCNCAALRSLSTPPHALWPLWSVQLQNCSWTGWTLEPSEKAA